jgi:serine/threonine protein kinase
MAGGDLQHLLRRQKPSLQQAINYIEQICAGLGHAHSRGIIHRDIKPQNLLLNSELSTVKIADFGVARLNTSENPITRVGTNIYAPPEHSPLSAGQTGDLGLARLTSSADIYSLAKSVYTLLTGDSPREYANQQITDLPEECKNEEWADELLRVLKRATKGVPDDRHQSVDEFWADLSGVRQIAADGEFSTMLSSAAVPQPHVSRGYSPIAPAMPSFEAIAAIPSSKTADEPMVVRSNGTDAASWRGQNAVSSMPFQAFPKAGTADAVKRKRRRSRRLLAFVAALGLFTGILYGTASYMRGRSILAEIKNPFAERIAVANTDIYLRPSPNTDNEPIGLVTKNSKVRIVNIQNNWYQVDVVQQGRARPSEVSATRGWLNGKYLDRTDN